MGFRERNCEFRSASVGVSPSRLAVWNRLAAFSGIIAGDARKLKACASISIYKDYLKNPRAFSNFSILPISNQ